MQEDGTGGLWEKYDDTHYSFSLRAGGLSMIYEYNPQLDTLTSVGSRTVYHRA